MKKIPLTQNQEALVDDADYEWLNQWKWCAYWNPCTGSYYAVRGTRLANRKGIAFRMHREILGLKHGDKRQGDHINHDTLDNRRENLRIVTHQENAFNIRCRGYCKPKATRRVRAYIKVDGHAIHLGYFDTAEEAKVARQVAKGRYHHIGKANGDV